ncbi:calsequestrin-1-like [Hydra vulgaris]|uniref:calsequestrin-1-like n=1 Tax=Hydra vulgaris TaxID=6087 RepID=UPI001F5F797F|nr:calsequestrin-1-like [Hydra vulgaris]
MESQMETIYADVNKAIYKYGKPSAQIEFVKPYEAMFVDGDSLFNLKNIDIIDEKEEYEEDYYEDDDEDDYNEDDEDDDEMVNEYDNDNDDDYGENDDNGENELMEINN